MKWLSFCSSLLLYLLILKLEFAIVVTRHSVSSIKALFNEFISFPGLLAGRAWERDSTATVPTLAGYLAHFGSEWLINGSYT